MINISQWRASIGLWYYQICDNVIDKSLSALCRKGTRAKKQSSNEKTNMNSTAVEQISSNEIPQYRSNRRNRYSNNEISVSSNVQKIVVTPNDQLTQVASTDGQTQVLLSNSSTANMCGRVQTISLAVFLFLLIILSGDIELNPGPKTGK